MLRIINKIVILSCLLICILFQGCADVHERIIGIWKEGKRTLEFRKDGTWVSTAPENPTKIWGTYKIDDSGDSIRMNYGDLPYPEISVIEKFEVDEHELTITIYGDHEYHFVKEGSETEKKETEHAVEHASH
jgi:hypothetical protein